MNKRSYTPPYATDWNLEVIAGNNILATLSISGNVQDFEAGNELDLTEDSWDI